jgi:hypothetical protein
MRCGSGDAVGAVGRALPLVYPEREYVRSEEKGGEGGPFSVKLPELPNRTRLKGKEMEGVLPRIQKSKFSCEFWK